MNRLRPYLAIILDSFHSAFASRVLWIAFVAIWILLGALAFIGFREDFTTRFTWRDFDNAPRLKAMLAQGLVDPQKSDSPSGRIAAALPEDLRRKLDRVGGGEDVRIRYNTLSDGLNTLFEDTSWYKSLAWENTIRFREARDLELLDEIEMDQSLKDRRTRLRIEAGLPGVFEARSPRSIILTYAGMDFPARFAVDKSQFLILLNQFVFPTIINWLLGFILVFLGVLVTASIVPDMLQAGSLHLLLSKPVSRSLLLLSKFIGGCAFVFLCVVQLIVGLYVVAGMRLDVWNPRLLYCIPVSVFVFAVFYSVSLFAGLRWRSPILAIGVTCIFGALCIVFGVIANLFDGLVVHPDRIDHVVMVGDDLFARTRGEGLLRWEAETNQWNEIFESDAFTRDRVLAPVAVDSESIVTAKVSGGRMNAFGLGAFDSLVISKKNDWQPQPSSRLPSATVRMHATDESLLAVNSNGIALTPIERILEKAVESKQSIKDSTADNATDWLSKLSSMMGVASDGFSPILPEDVVLLPPRTSTVSHDGKALVVISGKDVLQFDRSSQDPGRWRQVGKHSLDKLPSIANVALSDHFIVVIVNDAPIRVLERDTMRVLQEIPLNESRKVVSLISIPYKETFLFLDDLADLYRISSAERKNGYEVSRLSEVSNVESIGFDQSTGTLVVAINTDQVQLRDASSMRLKKQMIPTQSFWRRINQYVITPLRWVIPQTGQLGDTIAAIISGESSFQFGDDDADDIEPIRYQVMGPVVNCSVFIIVMLILSCLYFSKTDF